MTINRDNEYFQKVTNNYGHKLIQYYDVDTAHAYLKTACGRIFRVMLHTDNFKLIRLK